MVRTTALAISAIQVGLASTVAATFRRVSMAEFFSQMEVAIAPTAGLGRTAVLKTVSTASVELVQIQ